MRTQEIKEKENQFKKTMEASAKNYLKQKREAEKEKENLKKLEADKKKRAKAYAEQQRQKTLAKRTKTSQMKSSQVGESLSNPFESNLVASTE